MEAALRSAYFLVTGKNPEADAFQSVRGLDGWKEAKFNLAGTDIRVAVASGLGNARRLMNAIRNKEVHYDFVEIMSCPGGCINGCLLYTSYRTRTSDVLTKGLHNLAGTGKLH